MTLPSSLSQTLAPDERVLWHAKALNSVDYAKSARVLSLIATLLFAVSSGMALLFFVAAINGPGLRLTVPMLIFVGGPVAIGLAIKFVNKKAARKRRENTFYAITDRRILILQGTQHHARPINADTQGQVIQDSDTLARLQIVAPNRQTDRISTASLSLSLSEAEKAQAAILQAKATL